MLVESGDLRIPYLGAVFTSVLSTKVTMPIYWQEDVHKVVQVVDIETIARRRVFQHVHQIQIRMAIPISTVSEHVILQIMLQIASTGFAYQTAPRTVLLLTTLQEDVFRSAQPSHFCMLTLEPWHVFWIAQLHMLQTRHRVVCQYVLLNGISLPIWT